MPPVPTWFAGRALIGRFLASTVLREPGDFRMIPAAANGQPALAAYLRDRDGVHAAHAIQVLTIAASSVAPVASVARVVSFNDAGLFPAFGLPPALPCPPGGIDGEPLCSPSRRPPS
jgi:RNA polymerase sigma-70 factor (ECF subfamily)